ncbi:hypothetical protein PENSPDRAFT_694682 [Peniophora sp. CONT]|nr:hypothetical protein PENSPDRAFT_694682 [Peniophora sp. CONT]
MAAHSNTFTLPNELWQSVFREAQRDWEPARGTSLGWLVIRQVCHRWKEAADAMPSLWLKINPRNIPKNLLERFVTRSGALPVDITLEMDMRSRSRMEGLLQLLRGLCQRTRRLQIHWPDQHALELVRSYPYDVPALRDLTILVNATGFDMSASAYVITGALISQLRALSLEDCVPYWPSLGTENMTHLKLCFSIDMVDTLSTQLPALAHFLDTIAHMPRLLSLELDNAFPSWIEYSPPAPVHLPRTFETLSIYSSRRRTAENGLHLFEYLDVPPTADQHIVCNATPALGTLVATKLFSGQSTMTALSLSNNHIIGKYTHAHGLSTRELEYDRGFGMHSATPVISRATLPSMKTVETLELQSASGNTIDALFTPTTNPASPRFTLHDAIRVDVLVLPFGAGVGTGRMLEKLTVMDNVGGFAFFPRLKALKFVGNPDETIAGTLSQSLTKSIVEVLLGCRNAGASLDTVEFENVDPDSVYACGSILDLVSGLIFRSTK